MKFTRLFTTADKPITEQIKWKTVLASNPGANFAMEVEVPETWSQNATNVFAQRYLRKAGVPRTEDTHAIAEPGLPTWLLRREHREKAILGPETSAKQVFNRLAGAWTYWGWREGYFDAWKESINGPANSPETSARVFYDEIYYMLANQIAAPNSPQWFNTGLHWAYGISGPKTGQWYFDKEGNISEAEDSYSRPQVHACFIQPVSDDLVNPGGIMDLWTREVRLFKHGSGTGTNFSAIRGKGERLSGGGVSSGLMSFLRIGDRAAGAIASGGTTRRAAKMVCLDLDHPEIEDFIDWKVREEAKAAAMFVGSQVIRDEEGGVNTSATEMPQAIKDRLNNGFGSEIYGVDWEGEAIDTVSGQNSNNSVRVTDAFIRDVDNDEPWCLWPRSAKKDGVGTPTKTLPARKLWSQICRAAWASADPGVLFHDTINDWHTCKADGLILACNPCFIGETRIDTSEGKIRIDDLAEMYRNGGKLPLAFGFDLDDRMPTLSQIQQVWVSKETRDLIRVKTDKGIEFTCTPEHRILTRHGKIEAGTWVEAKNLKPGMRLRKIGRLINAMRGDHCTISTRKGDFYQNRFMWEQIYGPIPNGFEVHHKDDNPRNDRISNLELIAESDHRSYHFSGEYNPKYIEVDTSKIVEVFEEVEKIRARRSNQHDGAHYINWNKYVRKNDLVGVVPLANSKTGRIRGKEWNEFCEWVDKNRGIVNHRIVSVERFQTLTPVKVYDLKVAGDHHNFGVTNHEDCGGESIIAHNCGEYQFLDNTACNLASINLSRALLRGGDGLDLEAFEHASRLWTVVLDISVSMASYPSREIAEGSYKYRTLGLGYADVGGLLVSQNLRYDSNKARALTAGLTALMHGVSYNTSAEIAKELGAFPRWEDNKDSMLEIIKEHDSACGNIQKETYINPYIIGRISHVYFKLIRAESFRNAQTTLIAPTGTISLVMDCKTSGIEPFYSREAFKSLAGGGNMTLTNDVLDEDCAVPSRAGGPCLSPMAHVKMVAAVQPFLSGAVSKTINLPNNATIEDVNHVYREAHRLGLKAVALYRDGSKLTQPLSSKMEKKEDVSDNSASMSSPGSGSRNSRVREATKEEMKERIIHLKSKDGVTWENTAARLRLPDRAKGYRQKLRINDQPIYLHTGEYNDGTLGEIFIEMANEGSTVRALVNAFAKAVSLALQFGTPLDELIDAFTNTRFEPAGIVEGHDSIKLCSSILDAIFRDLAIHYLKKVEYCNVLPEEKIAAALEIAEIVGKSTGDVCPCGGLLIQTGTCTTCQSCGAKLRLWMGRKESRSHDRR